VRRQRGGGGDRLPAGRPQVGDTLAFWDSGQIDGSAAHEEHAEVVAVVWDVARQGRETGRVCVAIRFDGYDAELVRAIMAPLAPLEVVVRAEASCHGQSGSGAPQPRVRRWHAHSANHRPSA
jgi:hypothetical protein